MQNYPESLWKSLKKGCFPTADGELETKLRTAFFYGLDAGRELTIQSTSLSNDQCCSFSQEFRDQIHGSLQLLGMPPVRVKMGAVNPAIGPNIGGN
jgi:hypothetical protein